MPAIHRRFGPVLLGVLALAGCDRFGDPGAKLDRIEAAQKTCEDKSFADTRALAACRASTLDAAGKLVSASRGEAGFRSLMRDLGGAPGIVQDGAGAAFAELAVRRAAILTDVAEGKGPQGTVKPFAGWPDAAAGRGFAARWTAVRNADCAAYPVKNCARRLDAAMRRAVRELKPGR